ncbi:MAG TPA: bacterial Ig-like domain-containing protein, partial [Acholeplasma sp.]
MIKKLSILLLTLISIFTLVACGETVSSTLTVSGDFKTTYFLGQAFDPTGMIVTYHSDGQDEVVTDYEILGFDSSVVGSSTVTIKYKDAQTSFSVNILFGVQTSTELKIYDMPDILQSSSR